VAVDSGAGRHGVGRGGVSRMRGSRSDRWPMKKSRDTPADYPIRAVAKPDRCGD